MNDLYKLSDKKIAVNKSRLDKLLSGTKSVLVKEEIYKSYQRVALSIFKLHYTLSK